MQRADLDQYDLPDSPGVYIFRGPKREVLYVGKATSLRDRVRSYFASDLISARGGRVVAMVERAAHLTWQETGSVLEALILEANLIKAHQPPYNVDEKDDKSWNYVVITKEAFPRILLVRGRELHQWEPGSTLRVFGPFPEGGSLKEALKIVRKIFPYRDTCIPCPEQMRKAKPSSKCRTCFNAQIGLCPGVCSGVMDVKEYAVTIKHITQLFSGNMQGLKRALEREMKAAAKGHEYEKAAALRRQAGALEYIQDIALIKADRGNGGSAGMRIEAYDVAHTAGQETVGVMVAVTRGVPVKSSYRTFKIREATNDDPKALAELLSRRFAHPEWQYPRIIVVDGGKIQLRVAERLLEQAGMQIPIVGLVKDERHKPLRLIGDERAIALHEREILLANSEAHRFAISRHRRRLGKRLTTD
jgi:excinuclease ABC subunit C